MSEDDDWEFRDLEDQLDDSLGREIDLIAEVERLSEENRVLRKRLGIPSE